MAATVQSLRDILFSVKSPVELVDKKNETPIMKDACQELFNQLNKENVINFFQLFLDGMVSKITLLYILPNFFN